MQQDIFSSLSGMKTQKMNIQKLRERKFEEKVKKKKKEIAVL